MTTRRTRATKTARGTDATGGDRSTGATGRIKTSLLLSAETRRLLAVVAAEQGRELYEIAEEGLAAHLGKFAVVKALRRSAAPPVLGPELAVDDGSEQITGTEETRSHVA